MVVSASLENYGNCTEFYFQCTKYSQILAESNYSLISLLAEAMACGVPCVVTDVGDSAYIVGSTGKVVAPGDMIGLAEAMDSLLSLSSFDRAKLGEKARCRIEENFEISHIVGLYESMYREVL